MNETSEYKTKTLDKNRCLQWFCAGRWTGLYHSSLTWPFTCYCCRFYFFLAAYCKVGYSKILLHQLVWYCSIIMSYTFLYLLYLYYRFDCILVTSDKDIASKRVSPTMWHLLLLSISTSSSYFYPICICCIFKCLIQCEF